MADPVSLRVLVVDDDEEALGFVHRVLRAQGDRVLLVPDPGEALMRIRSEPVDLVFVSLTLPADGGLALVHHLRALNPDSDIVVLASSESPSSVAQAASLGMATTVVKPLSGDDLLLAVDRVRERRALLLERVDAQAQRTAQRRRARAHRRCLPFVQESDPVLLPEMIVEVFAEEFSARWVALYLPDGDDPELLRVAHVRGTGQGEPQQRERRVSRLPERDALRSGQVVSIDADGRHLLVPLHASHMLVGLAELRVPEGEEAPDAETATVVADLAAATLLNARRFEALAKSGIKDPDTSAYTFAYFVDHAGREIDKARRYGRQFSLGILTLDRFDAVRKEIGGEGVRLLSQQLVEAVLEVVRDTDVVARVEDDEIYLFMPETGCLGALTCRRRIEERFSQASGFQRIAKSTGLAATTGLATYPTDGLDLSMLLRKSRLSADRSRASTLRRLHLESMGFWEIVDVLVGDVEAYALGRDGSFFLHRSLQTSEDEAGRSRHLLASAAYLDRVTRGLLREAGLRRSLPGVVYGDAGTPESPSPLLAEVGSPVHVWILGAKHSGHDEGAAGRAVWLDDPRLEGLRFLLHLGERGSYGFLARPTPAGDLATFHTSEADLVEGLVVRLQAEYHLQKSLF